MAKHFTDFSEYSTGAAPSDWTSIWDAWDTAPSIVSVAGGKGLEFVASTSGKRRALKWDAVPNTDQVGIYVKFTVPPVASNSIYGGVSLAGSTGTETGLRLGIEETKPRFSKYSNGAYSNGPVTVKTSGYGNYLEVGVVYHMICTTYGAGRGTMNIWKDGETAPEVNVLRTIEDDSSPLLPGGVGLIASTASAFTVLAFGVGTGADYENVPMAPISGGGGGTPPTASNLTTTAVGEAGYSGQVTTSADATNLYWVTTDHTGAPSAAQVKAGENSLGATGIDAGTKAVSGTAQTFSGTIPSDTPVYTYVVCSNADGDSSVLSAGPITAVSTGGGGGPEPDPLTTPTNLSVSQITKTSATLTWVKGV